MIADLVKTAGHFLSRNSTAVLTGVAVAGVVGTAVTSHQAGALSQSILGSEKYTLKERAQKTWPLYVAPVVTGALTITAIVGAQHLNLKKSAALATAYSLTERSFQEYKFKVAEALGEKKETALRDEIVQDRVTSNPPSGDIHIVGTGDVLCLELISGRYFLSTMEHIRRAENNMNAQIISHMGYVSLNEVWEAMGLPGTTYGEEVGFNLDRLVDLQFSAVLSEDGRPCMGIAFAQSPATNYHKHH